MSHSAADPPRTPPTSDAAAQPNPTADSDTRRRRSTAKRAATTAITKLTRQRPPRTYQRPRPTWWFVIRRTWGRAIAMQVWDVAATMTFYLMLSLLPGLIALGSIVALVDFTEETIWTIAGLVNDLVPALEASTVANTLFRLIDTPGGITPLVLGLIGSLYSASNVVAAFHRAMNRIYDTREGRPFIYFRFVVFVETLVLMVASLLLLLLIILGGDFSVRLGEVLGLTQEAIATWNILKWPLILLVLIFLVSQAFYRGPNVRRPRYRIISSGAAVTVIILFAAIAFTGWLLDHVAMFEQAFFTVNGILYVILLIWLAFIVMLAAAAWDAEILRAKQLASGYAAGDELQLATEHTWVLRLLDAETENRRRISGIIVDNYHDDQPVTTPKTPQLTEAESLWAIREPDYPPSTGAPFHAVAPPSSVRYDTADDAAYRGEYEPD
ncbi:YihY/virulence factor BrkB family protein [Yaniella flava]|uniref:YihY/virulence factor BrkB family protein n=1 Tax=Yaniella flava TaxID=287930 RepID=A0ABN2ULC6_9MICC